MSIVTDTASITIDTLSAETIDVMPRDRDWSHGYTETWDYIEAPTCQECGDSARWTDSLDHLVELSGVSAQGLDDYPAWRCVNPDCEHFGGEIDPLDGSTDGPMMNFSYPLPAGHYGEEDADLIHDLPLCIVRDLEDAVSCSLALTGGGMDLSWEICEAYMRLGYLPPFVFCNLPMMSGRGTSDSDKAIIAACLRSTEIMRDRVAHIANHLNRFDA